MKIQHIKSTSFGGYRGSTKEIYTANHSIKVGGGGGGGEITGGLTALHPNRAECGMESEKQRDNHCHTSLKFSTHVPTVHEGM